MDPSPDRAVLPVSLAIDPIVAMLNAELADHPVYDGFELQWFDDEQHGTGMLAFLTRRADHTVDYYLQRGLRVDPGGYRIGGGLRSWNEVDLPGARLQVGDDGVVADVELTDVDGRTVEIHVDDRDGRARHRARLLAPVSAGVAHPTCLLLVWLPRFDLVRTGGRPPVVRIDGAPAAIGRLPGHRLLRRHLVKYAAPVVAVELNGDGQRLSPTAAGRVTRSADGTRIEVIAAEAAGHRAVTRFVPGLPEPGTLGDGADLSGRWHVTVDGARLTGGTWSAGRTGDETVHVLEVTERWHPGRLPWLVRLVTTVVPVFRRWPTTYRWRAVTDLARGTVTSAWSRTGTDRGESYLRATGSGGSRSRPRA